jgi:murein DD-endopeptidase MepM/ murein hydrolase activator NlpD
MGVGRVGLKMAGAGLKAGATIAKAAGGLASNLMPWNWSKWGSKSHDMMASEEAVSTLKSILQLLDERLQKPKRKLFGDSDSDGDRDGSLADLMGKRGKNKHPVKVKVPEEGEKKEGAWSKILSVLGPLGMILGAGFSAVTSAVAGMGSLLFGGITSIAGGIASVLGPIITSGLGAIAGLIGKAIKAISAARAASTAGDMFDDMTDVDGPDGDKKNKNGKGRGKGKGMGRASGKARGFFGRMVDGAKELGGKAADGMRGTKDAVVDKGGKAARAVKGQAGRAAKYVDGQVVKQVAKVAAGQAAKKAAVAGAGAGAAAVAASGALGAAAIAAAPIIATGVAVAGTAYTGYEIGNWAWKKWADVEELERLRFLQYGINPDDQDQVQMVRSLEEEFVDEVSWRNNTSPEFKLSPSEALEMWAENMGVDIMIQAHAEEWVTWFSKRFYPIVMNHLIACKNLGDINLDDVDDEIDEKRIPSYLSSVTVKYRYREKNDPFSVVASPFPGYFVQTNELAIAAYTDNLFTKYGIANPVSMESLVPKSSKETDGKQETDKVLEYEAAKALPKNAETSVTREVDKAKLDTIDPQPSQLETGQLAAKEEPRFNKPDPATAPVQIPPAPEEPPKVKLPDTATPAANPSGSGMVKYMRPCKGPITSPYGMRVHPIKKVQKMHNGIDIGAPGGTPIYASAAGTVFRADYSNSYGNVVYIRHANGWSTRYAHMQKFGPGISTGVQVQQGQLIGYVGNTGASKGNHLHFEMRTGSNYDSPTVDPAQYIGAASEIKAIEASVKLEDGATMDGSIEGFNTFTGAPESMQPTDKVLTVGGRTIVIKNEQNEETFDPSHNIDNVNRGTVDPSRDAPVNQTYDNVKSINQSSAPSVPSSGGDGGGYVPTYTGVPGFDRTPGGSSSSTDREFGSYEPVATPRVPTPESNAGFNTQMQQMERVTEDEQIKHLRTMANGITRLVTIAEQLSTNMGKPPAPPRETARGVNTNTSAAPAAPVAKGGPSNGGMGRGSTNIKPPVDVSSR